ncbi:MAG: CoA transferase [Ignavibacteriota bacterium]
MGGIRVLDFSHALAGPYCTLVLSDFGASVFKLESPSSGGDMGRGWGPPFAGTSLVFFPRPESRQTGNLHRSQASGRHRSVRAPDRSHGRAGREFRPGTMDRLGLGYAAMSQRNPRLVYCSISGYGQQGPSRDEAAMDLIVECSSGFMSITGTEEGEQVRSGYAVADINAGLFSVIGILMALRARDSDRSRPIRRRVHARQHDLRHVVVLHVVPRIGQGAGTARNGLPDGRALPRVSRRRPPGIDRDRE